jgi:hypothetical protein
VCGQENVRVFYLPFVPHLRLSICEDSVSSDGFTCTGGKRHVEVDEDHFLDDDDGDGDVSLISNSVRRIQTKDEEVAVGAANGALVARGNGVLAECDGGANVLASRSWRGVEFSVDDGCTSLKPEKGLSGIASGYSHERDFFDEESAVRN